MWRQISRGRASNDMRRLAGVSAAIVLAIVTSLSLANANPYLAKAGERPLHMRIATCAVSGGFAHLYTALENRLFDPYGFKLEHVMVLFRCWILRPWLDLSGFAAQDDAQLPILGPI